MWYTYMYYMQVQRWSSPYFHTFSLLFYAIDKIIDKLEKTFKSSQRTVDYLHCKNLQFLKSYFELFNYRAEPTL